MALLAEGGVPGPTVAVLVEAAAAAAPPGRRAMVAVTCVATLLSNNVAWKVVEDRNQSYYSKALSWSELSLKLEPKSHYSIDTYANLLYLNGQKQKAIETEQKAIDLAKKIDKTYSTKEYESVLEKMKNGTY